LVAIEPELETPRSLLLIVCMREPDRVETPPDGIHESLAPD
jgi:hypothetical protein